MKNTAFVCDNEIPQGRISGPLVFLLNYNFVWFMSLKYHKHSKAKLIRGMLIFPNGEA